MERLCVYSRAVAHFPMVVKEANFVSNYVIRAMLSPQRPTFRYYKYIAHLLTQDVQNYQEIL